MTDAAAIDAGQSLLLRNYAPTSLLLNTKQELLHVFGDVGHYLRIGEGAVTLELSKLLPSNAGTGGPGAAAQDRPRPGTAALRCAEHGAPRTASASGCGWWRAASSWIRASRTCCCRSSPSPSSASNDGPHARHRDHGHGPRDQGAGRDPGARAGRHAREPAGHHRGTGDRQRRAAGHQRGADGLQRGTAEFQRGAAVGQ
jgi:hypothetical protein